MKELPRAREIFCIAELDGVCAGVGGGSGGTEDGCVNFKWDAEAKSAFPCVVLWGSID